ncbi:DUF3237 domain-containing protein [Thermodesulfobacteriota bacterium]
MEFQPVKPHLEYLCQANIELTDHIVVGATPQGVRHVIPFTGRFVGDKLSGEILPGGTDCLIIRPDGTTLVDARYAIKTPDGALVYINNRGRRAASREVRERLASGETVDPTTYYYRLTPEFETEAEQYAWLNDIIAICSAARLPGQVIIDFYIVR